MNLQGRIEKLVAMLEKPRTTTTGSAPDVVGLALGRCLDEGRGECWHEAAFCVCRELATATDAGREMSVDEAFELAGVCGTVRQQIESFMELDEAGQVAFLDGLR